jgi:hypothetical protein
MHVCARARGVMRSQQDVRGGGVAQLMPRVQRGGGVLPRHMGLIGGMRRNGDRTHGGHGQTDTVMVGIESTHWYDRVGTMLLKK